MNVEGISSVIVEFCMFSYMHNYMPVIYAFVVDLLTMSKLLKV